MDRKAASQKNNPASNKAETHQAVKSLEQEEHFDWICGYCRTTNNTRNNRHDCEHCGAV